MNASSMLHTRAGGRTMAPMKMRLVERTTCSSTTTSASGYLWSVPWRVNNEECGRGIEGSVHYIHYFCAKLTRRLQGTRLNPKRTHKPC